MSAVEKRAIEDFLNTEVKDYSIEVIKNRALPSVIDGLKPTARKVVFTADITARQPRKTAAFVGDIMSKGGYEKGDGALPGVINGLVQDFPGYNNAPYLVGFGEFGSRKTPSGVSAPRYTQVKVHSNFYKYFKDKELHEFSLHDDAYYDPICFLPVLPTLLLNPTTGIAIGFACEFQPYNEKDIVANIKRVLAGKKQKKMLPYYKGFKGKVHEVDDQVVADGCIDIKGTIVKITEVPIGITREQYVSHLEKMIEKGHIRDYVEQPGDDFVFDINISRDMARKFAAMDEDKLLKAFKLRVNVNENLNAISENDTLLQFNNVNEIIEYFVKFRLKILTKRKSYMVKKFTELNTVLQDKIVFINEVLKGNLVLTKLKNKADLIARIKKFPKIKTPENVAGMVVYNITDEELKKLITQFNGNSNQIKFYQDVTEKELYDADLKGLK